MSHLIKAQPGIHSILLLTGNEESTASAVAFHDKSSHRVEHLPRAAAGNSVTVQLLTDSSLWLAGGEEHAGASLAGASGLQ